MNLYENFLRKQTSKQRNNFFPMSPHEVLFPDDDDIGIKIGVDEYYCHTPNEMKLLNLKLVG